MTEQDVLELLQYGEHIHLECKKAETTLPNSVWETYSSFANTDGIQHLLPHHFVTFCADIVFCSVSKEVQNFRYRHLNF